KGMVLDPARRIPQVLEFGQGLDGAAAALGKALLHAGNGRLQHRVLQRAAAVLGKGGARRFHLPPSPIAGAARSPARISATWRTSTSSPLRRRRPARWRRQPRSAPVRTRAPVAVTLAILESAMASEIWGYLTANRPPKPQHSSGSAISATFTPDACSRRRGSSRTP